MNKDELIQQLAKEIKTHRILEKDDYCITLAVGTANIKLGDSKKKIWMINGEIPRESRFQQDITGSAVGVTKGQKKYINDNGTVINKNSKFGEIIIRNSDSIQSYIAPSGEKQVEIINSCFYTPNPNSYDASDLRFNIKEPKPRYYNSLIKLLEDLSGIKKEIKKLDENIKKATEEKSENELNEFLEKKEKTIKEYEEKKRKVHSFIRKNAELRLQPILDRCQDEIKRSHIYDGVTLAINGGPGTGKTTSLIQRLKFLTDSNALEDYKPDLPKGQKEKVLNGNRNWVFFSPTELLKLFLRNNMISEGLKADDSRVLVWNDHKSKLLKEYKLFNSETQNPFLALRKDKYIKSSVLPYKGKDLQKILKEFEAYYLKFQNEKLENLLKIEVGDFIWAAKGASILNYINNQEKDYTKRGLINLYFNLNRNFVNEIKDIEKEANSILEKETAAVLLKISSGLQESLISQIEKWNQEKNVEDVDVELEEDSEEGEEDVIHQNPKIDLFNKIKSLLRKIALIQFDKKTKLSKRERELKELLKNSVDFHTLERFDKIGQYAYFIKYFAKAVKGVVTNLYRDIPNLYKRFRKEQFKERKNKWNYEILEHLFNKDQKNSKRIHPNEQAFLLYFINNMVKEAFKLSRSESKKIRHPYFEAFLKNSWPVIGIDEATDFHLIDLLAIKSLADYEVSSVTFSGDIMQRLTSEGIRNWSELKLFDKKVDEKDLLTSYRQSPTLLAVAQEIYNEGKQSKAEYVSFMDKDDKEPAPLMYINDDEEERIEWISQRVLEIYKAYGNSIPSIAIFLKEEDELERFARKLGDTDRLADVDIRVKACNNGQVLGDQNTIRVFSIDYIKGLEFEAVFFHDIQQLYDSSDKDLILKNLYVGLSRASFYLGVTAPENVEQLHFLNAHFKNEGNWKIN